MNISTFIEWSDAVLQPVMKYQLAGEETQHYH
jgi:hypothetical protein